jgi:hypothetical protein
VLHVVCEFNETAEPIRPSYALPATLKSEERRHGKTPFSNTPPLDQRLESHAKRLRNDLVCPVRDTCGTKRVDPETQNERVREWDGPADSSPVSEPNWQGGTEDKGARHVLATRQQSRRDRHRHRQEFIPHRWPRSARRFGAAPKVVAWPSGSAACQPAAVLDRHGGPQ